MRKLPAIAGLVVAALIGAGAGVATTPARPVEVDRVVVTGCWFEKAQPLDTSELICGDTSLMPGDAVDVYQLHDGDVPGPVWDWALQHGAPSDPTDGCECLYVPVGTVIGPFEESWVATYDGPEPAGRV